MNNLPKSAIRWARAVILALFASRLVFIPARARFYLHTALARAGSSGRGNGDYSYDRGSTCQNASDGYSILW